MDFSKLRTTRRAADLRNGRNQWFTIKAQAAGPTVVHIFDEIGWFGVTASDFVDQLSGVKGPIELHLNTPGGEVFDGIAIYNALKSRGHVTVHVDSLAASIGSVIAMAADPGQLLVAKNASMMIHDGFGLCIGNAAEMRDTAELLDRTSENIASIYADRTGKATADWRAAMLAETWYIGQEAVDAGLADALIDGPAETSAKAAFDVSVFANYTPPPPETPVLPAEPVADALPADSTGGTTPSPQAVPSWLADTFRQAFEEATNG